MQKPSRVYSQNKSQSFPHRVAFEGGVGDGKCDCVAFPVYAARCIGINNSAFLHGGSARHKISVLLLEVPNFTYRHLTGTAWHIVKCCVAVKCAVRDDDCDRAMDTKGINSAALSIALCAA